MEQKDKIAIFDLDGTLWKENSHIAILNAYFKTKFYTSIIYRALRHFFSKSIYKFICRQYQKIPKEYALKFELDFDSRVLNLLNKKREENWFVLILSNAPYEIAYHAAERLNVSFLVAPIGHKKEILDKNYSYEELFVCTDNTDDLDILKASNEQKIIWTKYNKDFFINNGFEME